MIRSASKPTGDPGFRYHFQIAERRENTPPEVLPDDADGTTSKAPAPARAPARAEAAVEEGRVVDLAALRDVQAAERPVPALAAAARVPGP